MTLSGRSAALLALLLGAAVIGFVPIFVRLTETGPAAAGFWRMALAAPLLAPFAFRRGEGGPMAPNLPILLAGAFFAGDLSFWHYGIQFTSVTNATVLANLTPIVVTIAGWLLFKERPARLFVLGVALGLAGAWIMVRSGGAAEPGRNPSLGDALSAATSLWYAGYFLAVRSARRTYGTMRLMFWSTLTSAAILLVVTLLLGEDVIPDGPGGWAACLGLALAHVTGQGAIAWALGRLPTATASVVVLVQPVVAAGLGWLLFSETITPLQGGGAVLALAGVVLAQWAAARAERPTAA